MCPEENCICCLTCIRKHGGGSHEKLHRVPAFGLQGTGKYAADFQIPLGFKSRSVVIRHFKQLLLRLHLIADLFGPHPSRNTVEP